MEKTHFRRNMPFAVRKVTPPELIIWPNIDFVNKSLPLDINFRRYFPFLLVNFIIVCATILYAQFFKDNLLACFFYSGIVHCILKAYGRYLRPTHKELEGGTKS